MASCLESTLIAEVRDARYSLGVAVLDSATEIWPTWLDETLGLRSAKGAWGESSHTQRQTILDGVYLAHGVISAPLSSHSQGQTIPDGVYLAHGVISSPL
jgi:hypothetical protein